MSLRKTHWLIGIALLLSFAAVFLHSGTAHAASGGTGTVDVSTSLNVRAEPTTSSAVIGILYNGDQVEISNISSNWGTISYNGQTGYISMDYVRMNAGLSGFTVAVDAGHGGKDSGASANGLAEKNIVLAIAQKTASKLETAGADVIMTRSDDTFIELEDRSQMANSGAADIFVSIHANASSISSANGTEVYYYPGSSRGATLAADVQTNLVTRLGSNNRGIRSADFNVLRNTSMPAILAEIGFVTNSAEATKLATANYQDEAATGIVNGIEDYFN